jgi:hypothetical protein
MVCLADPVTIRREAGNPVGQWSVSLLQRRYDYFITNTAFNTVTNIVWFSTKYVEP